VGIVYNIVQNLKSHYYHVIYDNIKWTIDHRRRLSVWSTDVAKGKCTVPRRVNIIMWVIIKWYFYNTVQIRLGYRLLKVESSTIHAMTTTNNTNNYLPMWKTVYFNYYYYYYFVYSCTIPGTWIIIIIIIIIIIEWRGARLETKEWNIYYKVLA